MDPADLPARDPRDYLIPAYRRDPKWSPWESPVVQWREAGKVRRRALTEAWSRGELSYKLDPLQRKWYRLYRDWEANPDREGDEFVLDVSRRVGKTSVMCLIAVEDVIRAPVGHRVVYVTATERMARNIVRPIIAQLTMDCPPELRPKWVSSQSWYEFPNGVCLTLVGMDVDPDRARGTHLDRGFVDEGGFIQNLQYVLTSVLGPMMQGRKGACLLMGSTPPLTPSHYWSSVMVPRAKMADAHIHGTIFDNPRLSMAEIDKEVMKTGGIKSTAVRRELLAEHVPEETMAVVPEYRDKRHEINVEVVRPQWFFGVVGMDPGWKDCTGVVFGYWDFLGTRMVIEDEVLLSQANSGQIALAVKAKEAELWSGSPRWTRKNGGSTVPQPGARFTDVDHRLVSDLQVEHGLTFANTAKDNLDAQVNNLRVAIQEGRVFIHPRCKHLNDQLLHAVYRNQNRREFAREGDFGHFDLVSALIYTWRNIQYYRNRNPSPPSDAGPGQFKRSDAGRVTHRHTPRSHHRPKGGFRR